MSLFDLLRKRETQRELSAREYIQQAIAATAAGNEEQIDVGKLEAHLQTAGWTLESFQAAVEKKAEIDRLREIVAGKQAATAAFKAAAEHARTVRAEHEAQISELQVGIREADQTVTVARRRVDEIAEATQRLRQLEPAEHREGRMLLKEDCNRLRRLKQDVEQQRATAESDLRNVPQGKTKEHRERYVESRKQIIARADERLPQIEEELAAAMARFEQAEAEAIGA